MEKRVADEKNQGYYAKLFPEYPVQVTSPRKASIRIASRRVYVDFPSVYWQFIGGIAHNLAVSSFPQEEFKKQLEQFVSNEEIKKITTFNNRPLGTISLVSSPFTSKLLLKLKVNWRVFFQYLDNKAQKLISKVEKDGSNIKEIYNEIIGNYFELAPHIIPDPKMTKFSAYALEDFKKLLRKCGERQGVQYFLEILKRIIKSLAEELKSDSIKLWVLQLESDVYGIEECFERMDILACYFYLRNLLENFVKLVVYNDIAKNFEGYDELLRIFFFYEKIALDRCYSIKNLKVKYGKKLNAILQTISNKETGWEEIFQTMVKKRFPKLGIRRETLEEFQRSYDADVSLKNYWSACSEVMHNQSPLPFFSLLEVKAFKHFLKKYIQCFVSGTTRILKVHGNLMEEEQEFLVRKTTLTKNAKSVLRNLCLLKEKEIKNFIASVMSDENLKKETFFNPLTLVSLFHLSSPAWSRIKSGEFNEEDIDYLVQKVQPISFKVKESIKYELSTTLQILQEKMIPGLERISKDFSRLNDEEKKAVVFYLLVEELPRVVKF